MKNVLVILSLILVPVLAVAWQLFLSDSVNYYVVSVAILLLSMLPFFASFEIKSVSSRELTLVSTMIALAVISRAAFYFIPQVKPIAAVVIVASVCLGAQRGYIVGVFSAFISNFIFGQGIHTPFQMAALGLVGFIAGVVFSKLRANRLSLAITGFLLAAVIYGLIVDMSTILVAYGTHITLAGVIAVYTAGVPFSFVFGVSTAAFLFFFGEPFIKKVQRVCTKYGLLN
ncbi:MAG: ECF transporter S component [Ruminococcaceae bacterium]|nr:ECF transporter S component [Oscillospiraceae bacterium]